MLQQLSSAFRLTALLTILTGLIYPAIVTGFCQLLFKDKANGSLVTTNGQVIGSRLIGQNFSRPGYFHPRPSAAGTDGYDAANSAASNLGPTSQVLFKRVEAASAQFRKENPTFKGPIPADALTTSGSGLDPDISVANASAQSGRIAQDRRADQAGIERLIATTADRRDLGFLGEERVNVLALNLALDRQFPVRR